MAKEKPKRRTLAATWKHLEAQGETVPRDSKGKPFVPKKMPAYDDNKLGFEFFRTFCEDTDYSNLTLPHTYFGRSELKNVNFANTDLSGSCMCWNDFIECDFSGADLTGCDMRSSTFENCKFDGATFNSTDLRRSSFEGCTFKKADLKGAIADDVYGSEFGLYDALTKAQQKAITWHEEPGPEPLGG
jgi:uncharacterized protein YjbI with pentapeptide repeats